MMIAVPSAKGDKAIRLVVICYFAVVLAGSILLICDKIRKSWSTILSALHLQLWRPRDGAAQGTSWNIAAS